MLLLSAEMFQQFSQTSWPERARTCRSHLTQLKIAFESYALEQGSYPYHPKGEAHALYLLKPHLTAR